MPGRWVAPVVAILVTSTCSGTDSGSTDTIAAAQRWEYPGLSSIGATFIDPTDPGGTPPAGLDPTGVDLWYRYRSADRALRERRQTAAEDDQGDVSELVATARAYFTHVYSTGLADEMIAAHLREHRSSLPEGDGVPFVLGRPAAASDLDHAVGVGGCDAIRREYYVWLGHTNIDEVAHRGSILARYALDTAAGADCDWAITELVEHALDISGLD